MLYHFPFVPWVMGVEVEAVQRHISSSSPFVGRVEAERRRPQRQVDVSMKEGRDGWWV